MYSLHPLLWVWIPDLQNVYPLNISAKRLKPVSGICLAISCITYPMRAAKHTVMESFDSNAKHAPSAWKKLFFGINLGSSIQLHLKKEQKGLVLLYGYQPKLFTQVRGKDGV